MRQAPTRKARCAAALLLVCVLLVFVALNFFALTYVNEGRSHVEAPARRTAHLERSPPLHFVYSVGCQSGHSGQDDAWQVLQAIVLDHSFHRVGQRGRLTRLVSGCERDEHPRHNLMALGTTTTVFTPIKDRVGTRTYVQANRPHALAHFFSLESAAPAGTVYIILDPDFVFRKALDEHVFKPIKPGVMVAQHYGMAASLFRKWGLSACEKAGLQGCGALHDAPRTTLTIGVPYLMLREDWLAVLPAWIAMIPPSLDNYPGIESDMYAFAIASTALQQTRVVRTDFMVTCMWNEESVSLVQQSYFLHLCQDYSVAETRQETYRVNPTSEVWSARRQAMHPNVTHAFVFNKHWLKTSRAHECGVPLLVEPPPPMRSDPEDDPADGWHRFVVLEAVEAYNSALREFKGPSCNFEKRLILHEMHRGRFGGGLNHVIDVRR